MKAKIIPILRYVIGLSIGITLFYFAFRGVAFTEVLGALSKVNYLWVSVALGLSLLSHWLRGYRWKMLLTAAGHPPRSSLNTLAAVMVGYMANTAVPRLGEITRCTVLTQSDKIPFLTGAGTVFTERAIDVLCLFSMIVSLLLLEFSTINGYLAMVGIGSKTSGLLDPMLIGGAAVVLALLAGGVYFLRNKILKIGLVQKLLTAGKQLFDALLSVRHLKQPLLFLGVTLGIWFCYVLTTYLIFLSMNASYSFYFAYIVMVMGGIGMTLPAPGGVGPFHTAVVYTFTLFGYSENDGQLVALLYHTPQLILNIIAGAVGYFYLILQKSPETQTDHTAISQKPTI